MIIVHDCKLRMNSVRRVLFLLAFIVNFAFAMSFQISNNNVKEIGDVKAVVIDKAASVAEIARTYDVGFDELIHANPNLSHQDKVHPGMVIVLPTKFLLPESEHKGIVINLPEKRMYVYKGKKIYTYPVGIGRQGWATPEGLLFVQSKKKNPHWFVPKAVLKAQKQNGVNLPKVMPPGPDNPLGKHAIRLSKSNYLIHGTNEPSGVGKRSSAGCIRMYPEDIAQLYSLVYKKMPVHILNQPFKIRRLGGNWYIESHAPLIEDADDRNAADGAASSIDLSLDEAVTLVVSDISRAGAPIPNLAWIKDILHNSTGIPTIIAKSSETENFLYELANHRL